MQSIITKTYTENELAKFVFEAALKVHKRLGPGLLQSAYLECLSYELTQANLSIEKHKLFPIVYDELWLTRGYKIDLFVNQKLIIKVKDESIIHKDLKEVLTYLKLSELKLGMIIDFSACLIKDGIKRVVNGL